MNMILNNIWNFKNKFCIGCMPDYTYGDFFYLDNSIYAPKGHHNQLILNQGPNFYITSLSKFMDETFTSLPKLFVDGMIK